MIINILQVSLIALEIFKFNSACQAKSINIYIKQNINKITFLYENSVG